MPNTAANRLQLANQINSLMLRELGQGIEVEHMLADDRYARDVLLVCQALRGTELAVLAAEFHGASAQWRHANGSPGHVHQSTDWSGDTSGFGVTRPHPRADDLGPDQQERRRGWLPWRRQR